MWSDVVMKDFQQAVLTRSVSLCFQEIWLMPRHEAKKESLTPEHGFQYIEKNAEKLQ